MKVALRFVARRVTPDNTCSAIYGVSMVLLQLQTSAAWTEVVALLWWHPGTVLTSLDLLLILDISRGATPIVVLCENLSIDQLKFCVSCLRCYWYRAHRYLWRSCPVWHAITAHQLRCNVSPVTVHLSCWVERLKAPSNSQQRWLMWTRGRAETPSCGVRHRATEPYIKTTNKLIVSGKIDFVKKCNEKTAKLWKFYSLLIQIFIELWVSPWEWPDEKMRNPWRVRLMP